VLFGQDGEIRAVLDWELASIGPGEMDVAWLVALDGLVERFTGRTVPGFMGRDAVVACYERSAGRELRDLEWHELFALTRSVAVGERLSIVGTLGGMEYPGGGGNDNPVLRELCRRIDGFAGDGRTDGR
jgi:aminoglycoside phosphotransferase (APT) family kinase protein